jgi:hypothetical protein
MSYAIKIRKSPVKNFPKVKNFWKVMLENAKNTEGVFSLPILLKRQ